MSNDVAILGIKVDPSGVTAATRALSSFSVAGTTATRTAQTTQAGLQSSLKGSTSSIDQQVRALKTQADTFGMSARQAKLYELAANGATSSQLRLASSILKTIEAQKAQAAASAKSGAGGADSGGGGGISMLAGKAGIALTVGAGIAAAQAFLTQADAMDSVNARMSIAIPNAIALKEAQDALYASAQRTGTGYIETADLFTNLLQSTKELGVGQSEIVKVSETVSKAIKLTGANAQQTSSAIMQLGQAMGSGQLSGDELSSIKENALGLAQAIANGLGVSVGKLKEMGAAGELTSEKVLGALKRSADEVDAKFDKLPSTFAQGTERIANSASQWVAEINKISGATSTLGRWLTQVAGGLDNLRTGNYGPGFGEKIDMVPFRMSNGKDHPTYKMPASFYADAAPKTDPMTAEDRARVASYGSRKGGPSGLVSNESEQRKNLVKFYEKYKTPAQERAAETLRVRNEVGAGNFTASMQKSIDDKHKDEKGPKTPKARKEKGMDGLESALDNIRRDSETFGLPEVERKIIDLENRAKKVSGENPQSVKDGIATLRGTQAKHDAKVRDSFEFEKGLQAEQKAIADSNAAYSENAENFRALLDAKLITEAQYNSAMGTARAGQIASIQAHTTAEVESINLRLSKAKTIEETIALEQKRTQAIDAQTESIKALTQAEIREKTASDMQRKVERKSIMDEELTAVERYAKEVERLNQLGLPDVTYQKELQKAWRKVGDEVVRAGGSVSAMDDLARAAGVTINQELGQTVEMALQGNFKGILKSWGSMLDKMLAQAIAAQLSKAFFGSTPGASGGGGIMDTILGSIGMGPSKTGSSGGFGSMLSSAGSSIASFLGFADGGRPPMGQVSIVGENGPELFVPDQGGRIISNGAAFGGGGGSASSAKMEVNVYIDGGAKVTKQEQRSDGAGGNILDIFIEAALDAARSEVAGGGKLASAIQSRLGGSMATGAPT